MINHIHNADDFNAAIANDYILIDFYADWCGPCKFLLPTLESFASKTETIKVYKADVDYEFVSSLALKYSVRSIPTLLWFRNGEVVYTQTGIIDEKNLELITSKYAS
jgi:thioredoxin 1